MSSLKLDENQRRDVRAALIYAYLRLARPWREVALSLFALGAGRKHPAYQRLIRQIEKDLGDFSIIWQSEMLRHIDSATRRGIARGETELEREFPDADRLIEEMMARSPLQRETVRPFASKQAKAIAAALLLLLLSKRSPRGFAAELDKLFSRPLNDAMRILLNEIHRAEQIGYLAVGRAYPEIVSGWVWETQKDDLVCAICWILDGQWFPISEPFVDHPHGRCYPRYSDERTEGGQAFLSLREDEQRAVLGPSRYPLWRSGRVALADLLKIKYDAWGKHYVLKRLDELEV